MACIPSGLALDGATSRLFLFYVIFLTFYETQVFLRYNLFKSYHSNIAVLSPVWTGLIEIKIILKPLQAYQQLNLDLIAGTVLIHTS